MHEDGDSVEHSTGIHVEANARVGDITIEGDVAGRDIIKITEELTYDVGDLSANPYLGLASYTYATRAFYGGREPLVRETVSRLTAPGEEPVVVFVTGASGSGKSSFAQAGVVPALEQVYAAQHLQVQWSVVRPGRHPIDALGRALRELGIQGPTEQDWSSLLRTPEDVNHLLATQTPPGSVNVVIFDQFEELFTQAEPSERNALCGLLSGLRPFKQVRTHVIATLRADYLSSLFDAPVLLEQFKQDGFELRAMFADELARAIRRPLQAQCQLDGKDKRLDPALVERLVEDVGDDPSLLPLLQVTLRALWDEPPHRLVLERYRSLTDALEHQANQVVERDARGRERSASDGEQLMAIFLDLVEVALDDDPRRDVRRTIPKEELIDGHPERAVLIEELVGARLVSTSVEHAHDRDVEVVDIVHESLLGNWPRLREEIATRREALQQRERFRLALREWLQEDRAGDYLLHGVRLAEARSLAERNDVALREPGGRDFLQASNDAEAAARLRELRQSRRRQRILGGVAGVALVFAVVAIGLAVFGQQQSTEAGRQRDTAVTETALRGTAEADAKAQRDVALTEVAARATAQAEAVQQAKIAQSRQLASAAVGQLGIDPELSILLARLGIDRAPTIQADSALRQALVASRLRAEWASQSQLVSSVVFSDDGSLVASASTDGTTRVWSFPSGRVVDVFQGYSASDWETPLRPEGNAAAFALQPPPYPWRATMSPDGKLVATASMDNITRIWSVATGQPVPTLSPGALTNTAAFSPDSQTIVTGQMDGAVTLWNATSGQLLRTFPGHTLGVLSAIFSPDGARIASTSLDGTARVWDTSSGEELFRVHGLPTPSPRARSGVKSAVLDTKGQRMVTTDWNGGVRLWDLAGNGKATPLDRGGASGEDAAMSANGQLVVTAHSDGAAVVWDAASGQQRGLLQVDVGAMIGVSFSRDGQRVLTRSNDGTARMWDATSGRQTAVLPGHGGAPTSGSFSPDGSWMVTGYADGSLRVWDATDVPVRATLHSNGGLLEAPAFSPDGRRLVAVTNLSRVHVWDSTTWQPVSTLQGTGTGPFSLSTTGQLVTTAANTEQNTVQLFDLEIGKSLRVLADPVAQRGAMWLAVLSPDGQWVASIGQDKTARLWDARSGTLVRSMPTETNIVATCCLFFSPDSQQLITAGDGPTIHFWDVPSGREVRAVPINGGAVSDLQLSRDGRRMVATADHNVHSLDATTGQLLATLQGSISAVALSPDGHRLATAGPDDSAIRVWDASNGSPILTLAGHGGTIESLVFSPDGTRIASSSRDQTVRIWDPSLGQELEQLTVPNVVNAIFTRDGQSIVAFSGEKAQVFGCEVSCSQADLNALAATRITRELTPAERARYAPDLTSP